MTLQLRDGGRYRRRDGKCVTVKELVCDGYVFTFPFEDTETEQTYTLDGCVSTRGPSELDLVEELPDEPSTEPTPQPSALDRIAAALERIADRMEGGNNGR